MKGKRAGLLLIGFGVICIVISLYMLQDRRETEGKDKIEPDIITEDNGEKAGQDIEGQENNKDTAGGQKTSNEVATTTIELECDKPVQEINADMYEWPHENSRYANYKEPDIVVYLAQRKEWFDELVGSFPKYEGRDIHGAIGWDEGEQMAYYDHFLCEDVVPIYDEYEQFFCEGIIGSIGVGGEIVSFQSAQNSHEHLYYYYDENRNEKTDEFLRGNYCTCSTPLVVAGADRPSLRMVIGILELPRDM